MALRSSLGLFGALLLAAACGDTIHNHYDSPASTDDAGTPLDGSSPYTPADARVDAEQTDAREPSDGQPGSQPDASSAAGPLQFTLPAAQVEYVSGIVSLQLATPRNDVDRVQLTMDGALLATVPLPFQYPWDSASAGEGEHELTATALVRGEPVASVKRTFQVDATPPRVVSVEHRPGFGSVDVREPIFITFSEPVPLASAQAAITLGNARAEVIATDRPERFRLRLRDVELPYAGQLTVGVGLRDRAGLAMASAHVVSVALESWVYTYPQAPVGAELNRSAVASDGQNLWLATAPATTGPGGSGALYIWRLNPDGRWSDPTSIFVQTTSRPVMAGGDGRIALQSYGFASLFGECDANLSCTWRSSALPAEALHLRYGGYLVAEYAGSFYRYGTAQQPSDPASRITLPAGSRLLDYLVDAGGDLVVHRPDDQPGTPYGLSRVTTNGLTALGTLPPDVTNGRLILHGGSIYFHATSGVQRILQLADGSWRVLFQVAAATRFLSDNQRLFVVSSGDLYDIGGRRLMRAISTSTTAVYKGAPVTMVNGGFQVANIDF